MSLIQSRMKWHIVGQATQQKAQCTPTILSAGPNLALPSFIFFRPLSCSLSGMGNDCLTHLDHLISDSLILHLAYYFSCATTPQANLSAVCSRMIMTQIVWYYIASQEWLPKAFIMQSQTSENMWYQRLDYFLYIVLCLMKIIYYSWSTDDGTVNDDEMSSLACPPVRI